MSVVEPGRLGVSAAVCLAFGNNHTNATDISH